MFQYYRKKEQIAAINEKNIFHIIFFSLLLVCCSDKSAKSTIELQDEYTQRFFDALSSNDINVISSAIEYINNIIITENDKSILSIHYDKARLLYKLGKYDEALEALNENEASLFNNFLEATLLIQMGNSERARIMLSELKTEYLIELDKNRDIISKRGGLVRTIIGITLLLDHDYDFEVNDLVKKGIFTEREGNELMQNRLTKELILQNLWPE